MLTQIQTQATVQALPFCHLVTMINKRTGDEQILQVSTQTDRFSDVFNQISWMRAELGLKGYEIWEVIPSNNPAPF